jgi:Tol biopolymer transport system component
MSVRRRDERARYHPTNMASSRWCPPKRLLQQMVAHSGHPQAAQSPPATVRRRHRSVAALGLYVVACCLLGALAACSPVEGVFGPGDASPETQPAPTQRTRATPVATIAGPAQPTPIAPLIGLVPERTLAFVSDRGGQIDLYLTDIASRRVWRLTNDAAIESFPVWSPDGTTIAYVVENERAVRNLWLLDLREGVHRQITREEPPFDVRRPAWLRGGRALIYDTGKPFDRRPELRAVTTTGQPLAPLLPDSGSVILDWDTNGVTVICAVVSNLGQPRIVVADAVPGERLHPDADALIGFDVHLSPDGQFATYTAPPLSDDQITYVLTLATGQQHPINDRVRRGNGAIETVPGRRYEHDFAWLPDSRRLVFVHGTGGVTDGQGKLKLGNVPPPLADGLVGLWITDRAEAVEERQRVWITTGTADAAPRPSPDGRWIAYLTDTQESSAVESNIRLIAVEAAEGRAREVYNLTTEAGNNWAPTWMPLPVTGPGTP